MAGAFSFIVLLAAALPLSLLVFMAIDAQEIISNESRASMRLTAIHSKEMEVKNAFAQVLRNSDGEAKAAAVLLALESHLEEKHSDIGGGLDLWFGSVSASELAGIKGIFGKCGNCWDFSSLTMDYRGRPILLSFAFISREGGALRVSRSGLSRAPEAVLRGSGLNKIHFGATLTGSDGGISIFLMPEGFG